MKKVMTVFLSVALIICGTQQHANATTISAISYDKSAIESFSVYIRPCLKNKSCTNGYDLVNY